jgi:hypothetical protein
MKIRIENKGGSPVPTRVVNAETGEEITNITKIVITIDIADETNRAELTFRDVTCDVMAEAEP